MDDQPIRPEDPQSVAVQLPPPTREQVWNALQQLPPELLLEFGNEIATLVEDENLVNELMSMALETPGLLSLAAGFTDTHTLPSAAVRAAADALRNRPARAERARALAAAEDTLQAELAPLLTGLTQLAEGDSAVALTLDGPGSSIYDEPAEFGSVPVAESGDCSDVDSGIAERGRHVRQRPRLVAFQFDHHVGGHRRGLPSVRSVAISSRD